MHTAGQKGRTQQAETLNRMTEQGWREFSQTGNKANYTIRLYVKKGRYLINGIQLIIQLLLLIALAFRDAEFAIQKSISRHPAE